MRRLVSALALAAALGAAVPVGTALAEVGPPDAGKRPPAAHAERDRHGPGMRHHRHRGPLALAAYLSAMETGIGIRPDQQAAWLDYTNALQATLRPPARPERGKDEAAFAGSARLAALSVERAKHAEALSAAIDKLRATLSPEQLERAKQIEADRHRQMAAFRGGHEHRFSPHRQGPSQPDGDKPAR